MTDARRIASIACFMLVTLRLMLGWQLLYEGFWKIRTLKSPTPWTAAGYLKNSQGPMRDHFRNLAGDADDLSWIDAKSHPNIKGGYWVPGVETRWDNWQKKFVKKYSLDEGKQKTLNRWINGSSAFEVELAELPASVDFAAAKSPEVSFVPEKKRLRVKGHLLGDKRNRYRRQSTRT